MSAYRLLSPLGRGGMGIVYRAERVLADGLTLPAACKAIHPEYGEPPDVAAFFRREAAVALQLSVQHANLVTVYDFFRDGEGRLMLAMELVDGVPLSGLGRAGVLLQPIIRRVLYEVVQALAYVHACGVLHRDVSPENILLSKEGAVKLSDFGLSKVLADPGPGSQPTFKGKAPYASPEALQAQALDPRADLWSVAAMAHELLAGAPPFGRGDVVHIFRVQSQTGPAPLPADVAEDLRAFTADLAVLDADARRFQTAEEMLRMLEEAGAPMSTPAELGALVQRACGESAPGRADDALAHTLLSPTRAAPGGAQGAGSPRPRGAPAPGAAGPPRRPRGLRGLGRWMRPRVLMPAALLALAVFLAGMLAGRGNARHEAPPAPAPRGAHAAEARPRSPASAEKRSPHTTSIERATTANSPARGTPASQPLHTQEATGSEKDTTTMPLRKNRPEQRRRARRHSSERRPKRHVVPDATIPR